MNAVRYLKVLLLGMVFLTVIVSPVWAAPVTNGSIVNFADTVVSADTTAESVIVVGGNAIIAGTVTDEVVVLNGNVTLTSTAYVHDRVIVLGGNISAEDGSYVGKGVFRIGGDFTMAATLVSAGFLIMLLWFINIVVTVGLIAVPVALAWGFKAKVQEMGDIIRAHTIRAILVGVLGGIALVIIALILSLTIIGIPVAILLVLLALLAGLYGLGGVCYELGRSFPLSISAGEREILLSTLHGAVLLALAFNAPVIGLVTFILSLMTGFGIVIIKLFTKKENAE